MAVDTTDDIHRTVTSRAAVRWAALIATLHDGPLARPELIARLGVAYPPAPSARPMLDRDVRALATLGIAIVKTRTRPPVYTLLGGVPVFTTDQIALLAVIRDTFGARHPQAAAVHALLELLTRDLTQVERAQYEQRQAQRVMLDPAIDYTPFRDLIARLGQAVSVRELLSFRYHATGRATPMLHEQVEPIEIEYRDRHFYFVGYHRKVRQIIDYRIDRIDGASLHGSDRLPPGTARPAPAIVFRYRLAAQLARGAISERFANQRVVERLPNGDAIIAAEGRSAFLIIQQMLRYGDRAELLTPGLREEMIAEVQRLAAVYQRDPG